MKKLAPVLDPGASLRALRATLFTLRHSMNFDYFTNLFRTIFIFPQLRTLIEVKQPHVTVL